jgi:hypothetical protein
MYSRLRKNHRLVKTALLFETLDDITLDSGDSIEFQVRVLANRPWFCIIHGYPFSSSSYYDGSDFDRACDIYEELLIAFKGVRIAEQFKKSIPLFKKKIMDLNEEKKNIDREDNYQALKRDPLFLGIDQF